MLIRRAKPILAAAIALVALVHGGRVDAADKPTPKPARPAPLKVTSLAAQAVVLPPRALGEKVIRAKSTLAVELLISVENYVPRGFEPLLVADGKTVPAASGVRRVDGKTTVLGYVIEDPKLVRDGAALEVQPGEDVKSRARVPTRFSRARVKPLPEEDARKAGVPTLKEWFGAKK